MTSHIDELLLSPATPSPNLVRLEWHSSFSWAALTALKAFAPHLVRLDRMDIGPSLLLRYSPGHYQISSEVVGSQSNILSMFQPTELRLYLDGYYHSVRLFLEALDLTSLQSLYIGECKISNADYKNSPQAQPKMEPIMHVIEAPVLTHLEINLNSPVSEYLQSLAHISAEGLGKLVATMVIYENWHVNPPNKDIYESVESFVRILCSTLGPDSRGGVKFPNLSSIQASVEQNVFRGGLFKEVVLERQLSNSEKRVPHP